MKFPPLYQRSDVHRQPCADKRHAASSGEREIEKASVMDVNMQIGTAVRVYKCTTRENSNFTRAAVMSLVFICEREELQLSAAGKDISSLAQRSPALAVK